VGVDVRVISAGKVRRYAHLNFLQHFTVRGLMWSNFKDTFKIGKGFFQSVAIMRQYRPDVVFTKGGYVCLPVGAAAHLLKIPLVIHDSDTKPGLTNRLLSRWANVIATGSPLENYDYPAHKSHYTGVPISAQFRPKTAEQQRAAKKQYGFHPDRLLTVVVGGGLGAKSINNAMNNAAKSLLEQGMGVYVVAGKGHYEQTAAAAPKDNRYKVVPFVYDNMDQLLGAADIVVSRGSATFLQELAGLAKAVVIVPARQLGDQLKNAQAFTAAGAAVVVDDEGIESDDRLQAAILALADDPVLREKLGKKLHTFAKPRATKDLAALILTAAKR
jgi:UDP-N-acetylglucosamine--N-acetylmuramyl-(pentapeptide) pyrophosphoryl-undecaprenol N-acetylglucosamine transferase